MMDDAAMRRRSDAISVVVNTACSRLCIAPHGKCSVPVGGGFIHTKAYPA